MSVQIRDYIGKRVHMIGIGGSSMFGLAQLLKSNGYLVDGSDNVQSAHTQALNLQGIRVRIGHLPEYVKDADIIIYSAAISAENPERAEAARLGIPQLERTVMLGQLMDEYKQAICVCGTHGKTTTTAMLTHAVLHAGLDPSVHFGGDLGGKNSSTRIGTNGMFIVEACEFNANFLNLNPTIAIILNIEADHLDYYRDIDHIRETFSAFADKLPDDGWCIGCLDDDRVKTVLAGVRSNTLSYGFNRAADWTAEDLSKDEMEFYTFTPVKRGKRYKRIKLSVAGKFNVLNALSVLACADILSADIDSIADGISDFTGVKRRYETTGIIDGVRIIHDYAHNPAEMKATLEVARTQAKRKLFAVMQPHTYSRVKRLFDEYISCCDAADYICVTDIYAAREVDPGDINSGMIVDEMLKKNKPAHLTPSFDDTENFLRKHWAPGDIVITMGCGNINLLNEQLNEKA